MSHFIEFHPTPYLECFHGGVIDLALSLSLCQTGALDAPDWLPSGRACAFDGELIKSFDRGVHRG